MDNDRQVELDNVQHHNEIQPTRPKNPHLDAIRGQEIPIILQNGQELSGAYDNRPHPKPSDDGDLATEASRMTIWDRGESLFFDAYPPGSDTARTLNVPKGPSIPETQPLENRLLSLRCKSYRPKGTWFFPRGSVEALITEVEVAKVITEGRNRLKRPLTDDQIWEYAREVCREQILLDAEGNTRTTSYRKMFAILVLIDRGWEIVYFVDEGIWDADLPLRAVPSAEEGFPPKMRLERDPHRDLECMRDWKLLTHGNFDKEQWTMISLFFGKGNKRSAWFFQLDAKDVLPWTKEWGAVHQGGYGFIHKVEIHPSHHNFERNNLSDGTFAVKHFKANMPSSLSTTITATPSPNYLTSLTSSSTSTHSLPSSALDAIRCEFEREIEILNRFSGDVHPHLVSLQAAFRHGDDYCVIFPWAESDLRTLWRTRDSGDPLEKDNLKWVLEQCRGMASGLQAIHVYQTTETRSGRDGDEGEGARMRSIYGRHGDIKPENILLFRDQGDVSDRGRLVITDFGLARFHSDGTKTYFSHKELAVTMSYRPPESDMEGRTISRSVDIWSFGCLLLEFVSWHLGGWELIKKFMEARKAVNMLLYEWSFDQFFEVVRLKNMTEGPVYFRVKHEVHESVNEMHAHPSCSDPIHHLLDFIMERMLVVESKGVCTRAECGEVHMQLDNLCKKLADPSYKLTATPRPRRPVGDLEAVEIPLDTRAQGIVQPKFTQLREHTGSTRSLKGRSIENPGRGNPPKRARTIPMQHREEHPWS